MRALNTSPSASSYVSPSVLPARAGLGVCEPEFALVSLGWAVCVAGGVLLPPAGLSRCTAALARPLLLLASGSCRTLRVRVACEVASDFACDLPLLPEEAELDLLVALRARASGRLDGLGELVLPPVAAFPEIVVARAPAG